MLTGLLAACGGGDAEEEPTGSASSGSESAESSEGSSGESSEDATDGAEEGAEEPSADSEPTAPGTVLEPDEPAVVELPYTGGGRGLYAVDLVSVEEQPLSQLPPDVPTQPGDTLFYVTQDWTMLDRGTGSVTGMNLLNHTSVSIGDDFQITSVLFADTSGCEVNQFVPEDGDSGKTRTSCTAYLVPQGESIEQVWYFEFTSDFDYSTGGDPVRWRVDV